MKEKVWVVGIGMTPFSVHKDSTVRDLTAWAVNEALADAGATKSDIGAAFFGNMGQGALEGQYAIPGQIALRDMGFEGIPMVNVENACATGASAFQLAVDHIRAGANDIALAVGVEHMTGVDRAKAMTLFDGAFDVSQPDQVHDLVRQFTKDTDAEVGSRSVFMDIYSSWARLHGSRYDSTQRQLATIASKNHLHGSRNPRAHFRREMSVDEILAGRALMHPLTVPMCAPLTDGAAAAVLCNKQGLDRLRAQAPVEVLACVVGTGVKRDMADYSHHVSRLAALRAYERAGVSPSDVSVAEVHDATAFGELLQTELLGFCEFGQGGHLAESGATTVGGRIPINPSGGLESKGHPLAATGIGQIFELVDQLRGRAGDRQVHNARIGLAENGGGFYDGEEAVAAVTILGV